MPALGKNEPSGRMNVDEFLRWSEHQEGRWELHDGVPVRKHDPAQGQSERASHARVKARAFVALEKAMSGMKQKCEVMPDGMTVRINDNITYEPDALVYCGDRMDGDEIMVPNPVIIVEVLAPSTACKDAGGKLADYFSLPSVAHYLVIGPGKKLLAHHFRDGQDISAHIIPLSSGRMVELDPPGISFSSSELLP